MKKFFKVLIPILLAFSLILGAYWYLFVYDQDFTRDMLLSAARYFEGNGNLNTASWFYDQAYAHGNGRDEVAIELARQYINSGNYTQAEVTLNRAIKDGGGAALYIELCKIYVEQDKLLDAVQLLDNISDAAIREEISAIRPEAPSSSHVPGFYNTYIELALSVPSGKLYANALGEYPSVKKDLYRIPIKLHDGENVLYAVSVAENGLVSPLSIYSYTIGGVVEKVNFKDDAIESAVRQKLMVSASKTLYTNDLWGIQEFVVPADALCYDDLQYMIYLESLTIENGSQGQLSFIEKLTNLRTLNITNTPVTSDELNLIGQITSLQSLKLNGCSLSTTSGLEKLSNITYLDLSNNAIRNISALSSMPMMQELYMSTNALQDLNALSNCTQLTRIDVSHNTITSIDPIAHLQNITYLNLNNNSISNLSQIGTMTGLQELFLSYNGLIGISQLETCTSLVRLDVSHNNLESIDVMGKLTNVMYLDFSNNKVKAIPKFQSDCKLVTIDGSYNELSDLSGLKGLKSLNKVVMDHNSKISKVSILKDCPLLSQVDVFGTKVSKEDARILEQDKRVVVNRGET